MRTREVAGRFVHSAEVERLGMVPCRASQEGVRHAALVDRIDIGSRPRAETGVEIVGNATTIADRDRRAEHSVERVTDLHDVEVIRCVRDRDDLTHRMHTCVCTPGTNRCDRAIEQLGERILEITLDRADVGLPCEAMEGPTVVRDVEPQVHESSDTECSMRLVMRHSVSSRRSFRVGLVLGDAALGDTTGTGLGTLLNAWGVDLGCLFCRSLG